MPGGFDSALHYEKALHPPKIAALPRFHDKLQVQHIRPSSSAAFAPKQDIADFPPLSRFAVTLFCSNPNANLRALSHPRTLSGTRGFYEHTDPHNIVLQSAGTSYELIYCEYVSCGVPQVSSIMSLVRVRSSIETVHSHLTECNPGVCVGYWPRR